MGSAAGFVEPYPDFYATLKTFAQEAGAARRVEHDYAVYVVRITSSRLPPSDA